MNLQEITKEINDLPLGIVESKVDKVDSAIKDAASAVQEAGLFLVRGGSSPSASRSYSRLYLQKVRACNHDYRTADYKENVIEQWEWETYTKHGMKRITAKSIMNACAQIEVAAQTA